MVTPQEVIGDVCQQFLRTYEVLAHSTYLCFIFARTVCTTQVGIFTVILVQYKTYKTNKTGCHEIYTSDRCSIGPSFAVIFFSLFKTPTFHVQYLRTLTRGYDWSDVTVQH